MNHVLKIATPGDSYFLFLFFRTNRFELVVARGGQGCHLHRGGLVLKEGRGQ